MSALSKGKNFVTKLDESSCQISATRHIYYYTHLLKKYTILIVNSISQQRISFVLTLHSFSFAIIMH